MSKNLKRIISCLITLTLIVFGIRRLDVILRPTDTDSIFVQIANLHRMPANAFEVMVYGSSHGYSSVNPMQLYQSYGIGAYNYSMKWQKINSTKLSIQDSLLTQKPKLVLIETFFAYKVLEDTDITGEIYYTRYYNTHSARLQYLRQCFGDNLERYLSFYMPLCAFHENWNSLTQKSFEFSFYGQSGSSFRDNMGYFYSETVKPIHLKKPSEAKHKQFKDAALKELDEIVEICRSNDIEILFYTVPYQSGYSYGDAMQEYASSKGIPYLNLYLLSEELGIDEKTDFRDETHLNDSGASKVTEYLGKYIVEHYDMTDMRLIDNNLWEQTLAARSADNMRDYGPE